MSQDHLEPVLVLVGGRAGQGLERDNTKRVDVGCLVRHAVGAGLLGGHVSGRSDHEPGPRQVLVPARGARDAEISEERIPLPIDHHVGRLEIPVHDPLPVRVVERPSQLAKDVQKLIPRHTPLLLHLLQRPTLEIPHDDIGGIVVAVEIVDGEKVRMLKPRDEPCLALESLSECLIVEDARADDFDGHVPVHARLIGSEDRGHSARADLFGDFVST